MFREQRQYGNDPELVRRSKTKFADPMKWPEGRLVFTCSWSDWFHDAADRWRPEAWEVVRSCPQHTFQILTKRPELILDRLPDDWGAGYPNVWLGVSIENARHTFRAELLRQVPAALRFISAEPLLGSLYTIAPQAANPGMGSARNDDAPEGGPDVARTRASLDLSGIGWIIIGGESGPKGSARPMHPDWAREIRDAVLAVSIEDEPFDLSRLRPALHMKQWGSWTPDPNGLDANGVWVLPDGRAVTGFTADQYGLDLNGAIRMRYAGAAPTSGGKYLDGTDWCEIPERLAPLTLI